MNNNIVPYRISTYDKHKIIVLKEQGLSVTDIANELGITRKTVYLWLKRWEDNGDVVSFKSSGRPRITSAAQDRQIVNRVVSNGFVRIQDISSSYRVSSSTIRRRLRTAGMRHRVPARKPLLTARHKQQRLQFAREYLNYDFSRTIFSDEKVFVSSADGRLSLWRPNNTRYLERNILPSRRSGRISFGVWGWMAASGPGELAEISGRMNSEQYTSILDEVLLPSLEYGTKPEISKKNHLFHSKVTYLTKMYDKQIRDFRFSPIVKVVNNDEYKNPLRRHPLITRHVVYLNNV
ncbi:hypothetical protein HF086_014336 [Spodoptera exigua]|uniref:Transposase Tc1-like domain-containing protein n=1 Tax=Spodoptera exigua TaxID=7107 RepID=A0A922SC48_SPOEX|nr:hypothetical protein HF086_014336 [Spodoptera exigua]